MKNLVVILTLWMFACVTPVVAYTSEKPGEIKFDFYGHVIRFHPDGSFLQNLKTSVNESDITFFLSKINESSYQECLSPLLEYKRKYKPDDWLYYQLVRKTAQQLSSKSENYIRYTLYKYFLMAKSGYNVMLSMSGNKLLFYIQSDENIYNIPYRIKNNRQFICLNFHDYLNLDLNKEIFREIVSNYMDGNTKFSYKITSLPEFSKEEYIEKEFSFNYYEEEYRFKVKLNPDIKTIFNNYPVVDYKEYVNIPLSKETYESLIPLLKKQVSGMNRRNGVDYLMRFTRYALPFETDVKLFGNEKRLSPEQTLLYEGSDCEDRVALFYFLVKEIYNLPMLIVSYPKHVTVAVALEKPIGKPIQYQGVKYTVCEPTPQKSDLPLGRTLPELKNEDFEIVYAYHPAGK